jgi:hypothetical protein
MSDFTDKLAGMADDVTGFMLGAVEDAKKNRMDWAAVALDEAANLLGKMQEMVEEADDD